MAEHTADTEQFPWSQHAPLTYQRFQLRNNFLLGTKNLVPNPFLIWSFYCTTQTSTFIIMVISRILQVVCLELECNCEGPA